MRRTAPLAVSAALLLCAVSAPAQTAPAAAPEKPAFARAASQDPKDIEATQMQGVTLFRMGKAAEAVPLLEKAHGAVASANVDGNYVLGLCYMDTRRYDDARRSFAAQYGFAPESAESYLLAARLLFRREYTP